MKRSCSKPSSRKETAVPDGPPIVRSTTPQVRRTPRRGKASRCGPWRFSNHHAQPSTPTRKACVGVTQAFRGFSLLLVRASAGLRQKTRFFNVSKIIAWRPAVSWAACGISCCRSWLPYFSSLLYCLYSYHSATRPSKPPGQFSSSKLQAFHIDLKCLSINPQAKNYKAQAAVSIRG